MNVVKVVGFVDDVVKMDEGFNLDVDVVLFVWLKVMCYWLVLVYVIYDFLFVLFLDDLFNG